MAKKTKWITSDPNYVPKPSIRPTPEELYDQHFESISENEDYDFRLHPEYKTEYAYDKDDDEYEDESGEDEVTLQEQQADDVVNEK